MRRYRRCNAQGEVAAQRVFGIDALRTSIRRCTMKLSHSPPVAALAAALLVSACSDARNPAAPRPAFLATAASATTYSGRATVVQAGVLGQQINLGDTGPLPPEGGAQEKSLLDATVPELLSVEILHASTVGEGNHSRSEASVAQLALGAGGNTISAGFLMARAEARCTDGGATTTGSSEIAELTINNASIVVSGEPNQTILLPNGQVVINEQNTAPGDITVNALHVVVNGVADVVVSSAHADIGCPQPLPPPPPSCPDFVTGGGSIAVTPTGSTRQFEGVGRGEH